MPTETERPQPEIRRRTVLCELLQLSEDGRTAIVSCSIAKDCSAPYSERECLLQCLVPLQHADQFRIRPSVEVDGSVTVYSDYSPDQYNEMLPRIESHYLLRSPHSLRGKEFKTRFFAEELLDIQSNHVIFQEQAANNKSAGTTKVAIRY